MRCPQLAIGIRKHGTFPELARATGNLERCMVPNNDLPGMVSAHSTGTEIPGATNLTIKEILSQIPEIADLYELTFEEHSRRLRCEMLVTGAPEPDWKDLAPGNQVPASREVRRHAFLGIVRTRAGLPAPEWVAEHLGERASLRETGSNLLRFARDPRHRLGQSHLFELYYDAGSAQTPRQEMPVTTLASGEEYLKLPADNGILISTLLALHLAAFAASSLVRYHPSYWAMLIGRTQGDSIAPIMSATMSAVEERYPTLILDTLGGR